jgi:E3 ubiquitin-protein ligase SHPRH
MSPPRLAVFSYHHNPPRATIAMAAVSATADVQSVHVHGERGDSALIDYSSAFFNLLSNITPSEQASGERASKRRKLDSGEGPFVDNPDVFDVNKSVVLGKVTLDLVMPFHSLSQ